MTNSIQQSRSWEANTSVDSEEGPRILRTPDSLLCSQESATRFCHQPGDIISKTKWNIINHVEEDTPEESINCQIVTVGASGHFSYVKNIYTVLRQHLRVCHMLFTRVLY
jgi:hypothetical protein